MISGNHLNYAGSTPIYWGSVFASRLRTRVFSVLSSFGNWIFSGSWSRHRVIFSKLISEPACSSQVDLHWASPHLPWGMQRICGPFFQNLFMSFERFCQPACFFCCSIYTETAHNSRGECNKFADLLFFRLSLCLSRDSLSCDTRSLDLCTLFKFICLYFEYIPPHSCALFTHFTLITPIFFLCILPSEIFFLSLMMLLLGI